MEVCRFRSIKRGRSGGARGTPGVFLSRDRAACADATAHTTANRRKRPHGLDLRPQRPTRVGRHRKTLACRPADGRAPDLVHEIVSPCRPGHLPAFRRCYRTRGRDRAVTAAPASMCGRCPPKRFGERIEAPARQGTVDGHAHGLAHGRCQPYRFTRVIA